MKRLLLTLGAVIWSMGIYAQDGTPVTAGQRAAVMKRITEATTRISTMKCKFTQTKTSAMLTQPVVAVGNMEYTAPGTLRWEYTSPYSYALLINGDSITTLTNGAQTKTSAAWRSGMRNMAKMVVGSLNGKNLFDERMFTITLFDQDKHYYAVMVPKRKDMRRMFSSITFYFAKDDQMVDRVVLEEGPGESTTIQFTHTFTH